MLGVVHGTAVGHVAECPLRGFHRRLVDGDRAVLPSPVHVFCAAEGLFRIDVAHDHQAAVPRAVVVVVEVEQLIARDLLHDGLVAGDRAAVGVPLEAQLHGAVERERLGAVVVHARFVDNDQSLLGELVRVEGGVHHRVGLYFECRGKLLRWKHDVVHRV
jgi:hypothetical protein